MRATCSLPGCDRTIVARHLCWMHYQHGMRSADPEHCDICRAYSSYVFPERIETCQEPGCTRDHYARGMCQAHYREVRRAAGLDRH